MDRAPGHRLRRILLALAALLLVAVAGAWVAVLLLGSGHLEGTREAWELAFGTRDQWIERFPSRETNAAARDLEQLAAAIGIELIPWREKDSRVVSVGERPEDLLWKAVEYVQGELDATGREVTSPPTPVAEFLESHRRELQGIRRCLRDKEPPRWSRDVGDWREPLPNLRGVMDLQKLLAASALTDIAAGRPDDVLATLEAAWQLDAVTLDYPSTVMQSVHLGSMRLITGTMRRLGRAPESWRRRLNALDLRGPFLEAVRNEAAAVIEFDEHLDRPRQAYGRYAMSGFQRFVAKVARPYVRLCLADIGERYRTRLVRLDRMSHLCGIESDDDMLDLLEVSVPRWNTFSRFAPSFRGLGQRLTATQIEVELTARVLELRAARDASGRWPARSESLTASRVCPASGYDYEVQGDGTATIAFRDVLESGRGSRPGLRGRYSLRP